MDTSINIRPVARLFKYSTLLVPPFIAFVLLTYNALLIHHIRIPVMGILFNTSLISSAMFIIASLAFRCCWLHRLFIIYNFAFTFCIFFQKWIGFPHLALAHFIMFGTGTILFVLLLLNFRGFTHQFTFRQSS